jgi:thioredoxin 1
MSLAAKYCFLFALLIELSFSQNSISNKEKAKKDPKGLSVEEFMKQVNNPGKSVLVHFEADWCALCKKIKPILDEIAVERADKIELLNINTDDNPEITKRFEIDGLPVMILYKQGKIVWSVQGFLSKKEILGNLDVHQ